MRLVPGLLCTVLLASGCAAPSANGRSHLGSAPSRYETLETSIPGDDWFRTELYFGLNKAGGEVTDAEWQEFVATEITPRFPEGLTIIGAYGQWKNASGTIQREPSRVMILLHPPEARINDKIEELRSVYCRQFRQESVLRVTFRAKVSYEVGKERRRAPAEGEDRSGEPRTAH